LTVRPALLILAVVLLLRAPFLNQAIQGDDVNYLYGAQHAQIDPLHPTHARYVFLGDWVDMRGHSHPPLNAWILALLLAAARDVREAPFHAAYALFSVVAALAMWSLARRFSERPLWATLLFLATPAFVVNGNSLESDLPFLAFWMAAIAGFAAAVERRSGAMLCAASVCAALAGMSAFQGVFLTPILAVYVWLYAKDWRPAWAATLAAPFAIALWQVFERVSSGALPAAVLAGYFRTYGFQAAAQKLKSTAALSVHALWIVCPILVAPAAAVSLKRRDRETVFLCAWIALFFAGAAAVVFAGSARYLLPMAAPVALLASRLGGRWLVAGFALQMPLSIGLAAVNYEHWDGYRRFAQALRGQMENRRVWVNGEWGLRFYMEAEGALPLVNNQAVRPGEIVVSSELGYPAPFTAGGGMLVPIARAEILPRLPLRIIGLGTKSAYSTVSNGYRPFDIASGPVDRIRADLVVERKPTLERLPMNAPEAAHHLVSGVYKLEDGRWRWMSGTATILLKPPAGPARLYASFVIPEASPARRITLAAEGREVAAETFGGPGAYRLEAAPRVYAGEQDVYRAGRSAGVECDSGGGGG
jgi:hypothetical protein